MKIYFEKSHIPFKPNDKVWLKVIRRPEPGYKLPFASVLDPIKVGLYAIKRKLSPLVYKLELPKEWKIHPVISVVHLEPYEEDEYAQEIVPMIPVEDITLPTDQETPEVTDLPEQEKPRVKKYIIEHLLTREMRKDIKTKKMEPHI